MWNHTYSGVHVCMFSMFSSWTVDIYTWICIKVMLARTRAHNRRTHQCYAANPDSFERRPLFVIIPFAIFFLSSTFSFVCFAVAVADDFIVVRSIAIVANCVHKRRPYYSITHNTASRYFKCHFCVCFFLAACKCVLVFLFSSFDYKRLFILLTAWWLIQWVNRINIVQHNDEWPFQAHRMRWGSCGEKIWKNDEDNDGRRWSGE